MSQKRKGAYLTKETRFGGTKVILYSLDGVTWSSRKDELHVIAERHEKEKITFNEIKGVGEAEEEAPTEAKGASDDEQFDLNQADSEESKPKKRGRPPGSSMKARDVIAKSLELERKNTAKEKSRAQAAALSKKTAKAKAEVKGPLASPKKRESTAPALKNSKTKSKKRKAA